VAAVPLSAACAKCGRNSNPPLPWNFLPLARSTNYEQPASQPLAAGPRNEKRQHPTGNCIDARHSSKSISFFSFAEGTASARELGRREGVARDKTRVSKVDCERWLLVIRAIVVSKSFLVPSSSSSSPLFLSFFLSFSLFFSSSSSSSHNVYPIVRDRGVARRHAGNESSLERRDR